MGTSQYQKDLVAAIDAKLSEIDTVDPLSNEAYGQCREAFESRSDQRSLMLDHIESKVIGTLAKTSIRALSVGCGDGELDAQILNRMRDKFEQIHFVGLEPNKIDAELWSNRMQQLKWPNLQSSMRVEGLGDQPLNDSFDLIFVIHSLYYIDDCEGAIDTLLSALAPDGRLVVCIAPNEELNTVANRMWQRQMDGTIWFSEQLQQDLPSRDVNCDMSRLDGRLTLPSLEEPYGQETRSIIDFIIQTELAKLPAALRDLVVKFLKSISDPAAGGVNLPHPVDVFHYRRS